MIFRTYIKKIVLRYT